jgi:hypothetical protein
MSSWSDRQLSTVTVSGWPAMRTIVQNFPSNMREMGDLTWLVSACKQLFAERVEVDTEKFFGSAVICPIHNRPAQVSDRRALRLSWTKKGAINWSGATARGRLAEARPQSESLSGAERETPRESEIGRD